MLEAALAALFGLLIGSFLNVCIYRFPRDLSIVRPARSFCPECEHSIAWYDKIPLLSYFLLKRKCRHCGKPIPGRYPIVEALTAALFFSFVGTLGLTLAALKFCVLSALLVGMIFSDLEERILPDEFTLGGVLLGLALSWVVPVSEVSVMAFVSAVFGKPLTGHPLSFAEAVAGAIIPSGFLWLTGELYRRIRHRDGLGLGDVKMVAAIGAFLGLSGTLPAVLLGSLLGSLIGFVYILAAKKDSSTYELPFGSFLGIGALAVSLLSQHVIGWYAALF